MEREILFRGKRKDNGEWIFGYLAKMWNGIPFIMEKCFFATKNLGFDEENQEEMKKMLNSKELALGGFVEVIPQTVGQFTGQKDKEDKNIFDNDILSDGVFYCEVEYNVQNTKFCINPVKKINGAFDIVDFINYEQLGNGYFKRIDLEIIGNVHDNPELIK